MLFLHYILFPRRASALNDTETTAHLKNGLPYNLFSAAVEWCEVVFAVPILLVGAEAHEDFLTGFVEMDDGANEGQGAVGRAHLVADLVTHGRSSLLNVPRGDDLAADEPAYCKNHHGEGKHDVAGEDGVLGEPGDGHENASE